MSSINSQLGVKNESTYGTPVTVDRFYQFDALAVKYRQYRGRSSALRASGWVRRADQLRVAAQGAEVSLEMEWMSKGMGWWLLHMLGGTATSGPTDSAYAHTGTVASLYGDAFTLQGNFPFHPAGTDQPLTLAGCKIPSWELSCSAPEGMMLFKPTIDARSVATATALASASYPAAMVPYAWIDIAVTIGGTSVPVTAWTLKANSNLDTERYKQQGSALHDEQTHKGFREFSFELECDWASLTQHDRVRAANAASAQAQTIITATIADTGTTIGVSTRPSTTITLPKCVFDDIDGIEKKAPDGGGQMQKLTGTVDYDGSSSPVTIAYVSADATA